MAELESTDPVYLAHRIEVLGQKGEKKIETPRLDRRV